MVEESRSRSRGGNVGVCFITEVIIFPGYYSLLLIKDRLIDLGDLSYSSLCDVGLAPTLCDCRPIREDRMVIGPCPSMAAPENE